MVYSSEKGFQHLCESVFVGLCQIVGTSIQVAIKRETKDIVEIMSRRVVESDGFIYYLSGSNREGFILKGSDIDMMGWPNDHRVIWDMSQSEYYYTENKTLILSDSSKSPPGFTLLELLTSSKVLSSCEDRLLLKIFCLKPISVTSMS